MAVTKAFVDLRGQDRIRAFTDSQRETQWWNDLDKVVKKALGRDTGAAFMTALRRAETDFDFWSETFLGIAPLKWQSTMWNDGLMKYPYGVAMLGNSGGKTVSFCDYYLTAGFWRKWSPEWWGQYRMLHHAPQEVQALEAKMQIDQILKGEHRAQRKWVPARAGKRGGHKGHWEYRPCLIWPFIEAAKHDDGKHQGFDFFGGSSTLTFRSTAFKAKATDGTDPYFIGMDEVRHELYLSHVVQVVFLPRFLRVPGGRLYLPFTPLEASPDALELYNRGATGTDPDWYAFNEDLRTANPGINEEDIARLERNTEKRLHKQIVGGKPTQAANATFQQEAVDQCFIGTKTPDDLDVLEGLRARVMARCPSCQKQKAGDALYKSHDHHLIGALDPASSSDVADDIVYTVWDLEPFYDKRILTDPNCPIVVYMKQAEPGTEECLIQNVAKHLADIAKEIKGPCAYDLHSALGHNVGDLLIPFDGDFVGIEWNSRELKLRAVDFLKGLTDRRLWTMPFHSRTKAQMLSWKPNDRRIKQDFLLVQVLAAELAKGDLPAWVAEDEGAEPVVDDRPPASVDYAGFGDGAAWGPLPDATNEFYGPSPMEVVR